MLRSLLWVPGFVGWLLGSGCMASYFAESAREHLAGGRYAQAIADYEHAVATESPKGEERAAMERARDDAARALVSAARDRARRQVEAGQAPAAFHELEALATQGPKAGRQLARAGMAMVVESMWPGFPAKLGRLDLPTARRLARLVGVFPPEHPIAVRSAALLDEASAQHLDAAVAAQREGALAAAYFHRRMARVLGAAGESPSPLPLAPAPVIWQLRRSRDACRWVGEALRDQLPGQGSPNARVSLEMVECKRHEAQWVTEEAYSYPDVVTETEWIEEPYYRFESPGGCPELACVRFDPLGICLERQKSPAPCPAPERVLKTRRVPIRRPRQVERQATREVHRARATVTLRGRAQIGWKGHSLSLPIQIEEIWEDSAYWSPSESKRIVHRSLAEVQEVAMARLARALHDRLSAEQKGEAEALAASAAEALDAGEITMAEDGYVRATALLQGPPPVAAEHFAGRYGLGAAEVIPLLGGQLQLESGARVSSWTRPPPSDAPRRARRALSPVNNSSDLAGAELLLRRGTDLGLSMHQTPLPSADLATGLDVVVRMPDSHLRLRMESAHLGGQASGVSVGLHGVVADRNAPFFTWGVAFDYQSSKKGGRWLGAMLPVSVHVPIWTWLTAELEARLNVIKLQDWIAPRKRNPHFFSPVQAGLTWHLGQRFFLRLSVAHYLGAGSKSPVDAGGTLGARL